MTSQDAQQKGTPGRKAGDSGQSNAYQGNYRFFIELSRDGIWCFEPIAPIVKAHPVAEKIHQVLDSACTSYNPAAAGMADLPEDAFLGLRLADLMPAGRAAHSLLESFFENGCRLDDAEWSHTGGRGNTRWFENSLFAEADGDKIFRLWLRQREISERRQVLEGLHENEKSFKRLSENMLDLIYETDLQAVFNYISPANKDLLGYAPEELLGTSFFDLVHPADRKRIQVQVLDALNSRRKVSLSPCRLEYRARTVDGRDLWVESIGRVQADSSGAPLGLVLTTRDVTQRNRAEKLQKALYRISEAANAAQDLKSLFVLVHQIVAELFPANNLYIALYDPAADTVSFPYFVDEYEETPPPPGKRYPTSELEGGLTMYLIRKGIPMLISPQTFEELAAAGDVQSMGMPSLDWLGVPLKTPEGKIIGVLAVQTYTEGVRYGEEEKELLVFVSTQIAMTIEHKRVQDALRESEARQRAILNALPDLILLANGDGVFADCYVPDDSALASNVDDMVGSRMDEVLPVDLAKKLLVLVKKALQTGQVQVLEHQIELNGSQRNYESRIAPCGADMTLAIVRDITERKQNEEALRQMNEKLTRWVNELEQRNREALLLNKMGDMLQSCLTVDEAYAVFRQYSQQLFKEHSGALYILRQSKNILEMVVNWGSDAPGETVIAPEDCWALRRGRIHIVADVHSGLRCQHLGPPEETPEIEPYLCIPMSAHGETIGLVHVKTHHQPVQSVETLASMVTEQMALALANLNLRDMLQIQSVRDPLTGLFNRRYLQETMERELSRAKRYQLSMGVIMADIDHFKRFNDSLGHDAGDVALQELGVILQNKTRKEDIACRYGGDEVAIVLPGATLNETLERAEQLRESVKRLNIKHQGVTLGRISMSFGVAAYPMHGSEVKDLLQMADAALYRAKRAGRDRVEIMEVEEGQHPD